MKLPIWFKRLTTRMPKIKDNEYVDLSEAGTPEQRKRYIEEFTHKVAKESIKLFYSMKMKNGFEHIAINDANGDEFILTFKKITK